MAARLFRAIGRPEMNTDPRYSSNVARLDHVEEVDAIVGAFVGQRTLAENLRVFEAAEVTVGPINDASDLLSDDYVIARESLVEVQDDDLGYLPMHDVVPRLSATPGALRRPAPRKGQHTAECLAELLGDLDLRALADDGVIFPEAPAQA
jgi:formyl-CoA transferase